MDDTDDDNDKVTSTLGGLPLAFLTTVLVFSPSSFLSTSWGLEARSFLPCLAAEAEGVTVSLVEVVASLAGLKTHGVKTWEILVSKRKKITSVCNCCMKSVD